MDFKAIGGRAVVTRRVASLSTVDLLWTLDGSAMGEGETLCIAGCAVTSVVPVHEMIVAAPQVWGSKLVPDISKCPLRAQATPALGTALGQKMLP